jgi:putative transposase
LLFNLPNLPRLEARLNSALAVHLPASMKRRPQRLALDLVLTPYHGLPQKDANEIYRGRRKDGTSHFHAYATLYVVRRGQRFTIAITSVKASEPLDQVVKRLIRQGARIGVKSGLLLLDRAFWRVDVIRYLQRARCPFLMPVIGRGRKANDRRGPSGTKRFYSWKRSGFGSYVSAAIGESKRLESRSAFIVCRERDERMGKKEPWSTRIGDCDPFRPRGFARPTVAVTASNPVTDRCTNRGPGRRREAHSCGCCGSACR